MSAHFTPTDEMLLLAETLGEVKTKTEKLEAEFSTQARPLEAATNALSAALAGIKALQFHVLDTNLGALSARVEEMRKAVDEQVGVIALELKKADETNAAKAGQDAEALRAEIAGLQAQLGTLGAQFTAQLARVEFAAKEEAKALQLIPGPAGATGASLNPRGTFIDGETYNRLDVVSWLGSSYIAGVDGVTEKPSKNSNQWQVLASRGGGAAGGAGDFGSLAGVAQINQGGTGQTTRAAGLNALLPSQTGNVQYMLLTDGAGTVSWGAQPVAGLPSQTSNGGKLLTTDGTNASWSGAVTVSGSNATVTGTLTVNGYHFVSGTLSSFSSTAGVYKYYSSGVGVLASYSDGSGTRAQTQISGSIVSLNTAAGNALTVSAAGVVAIPATTASTSTSTGALVVGNGTSGGLGVGGSINAGAVGATHNFTGGDGGSGSTIVNFKDNAGSSKVVIGGTGRLACYGSIPSTDQNTGSLIVVGGVGVSGNVNVDGTISTLGNTNSGLLQLNLVNSSTGTSASSLFRFNAGTRTATLQAYNDTHATLAGQLRVGTSNGDIVIIPSGVTAATFGASTVTIPLTTASTSTSSGSLVCSGGVGVAGAVFTGGYVHPGGDSTFYIRGTGSNNGLIRGNVTSVDVDTSFAVRNGDGSSTYLSIASTGLIAAIPAAAPSLTVNGTMTFERTSNTSLKISLRGTDGTTRSVSLTLA